MNLAPTDEETEALLKELDGIIDFNRYPFSPRIWTLQEIRAKIKPYSQRELVPPPKVYDPPRATAANRRRLG